jgi:hypothetical protein
MGILQIKKHKVAWFVIISFLIEFNKTGKDKLISNSMIETVGSYCEVNRTLFS